MGKDGLRELARYYGIQTEYRDVKDRRCSATPEALLRALQILGAPIERLDDVVGALRTRRQERWRTMLEPVAVKWDDRPCRVRIRVPERLETATAVFRVELEEGETWESVHPLLDVATVRRCRVEGEDYLAKDWVIARQLPWGYHRLTLEIEGHREQGLVIAAPPVAYAEPPGGQERFWGVFVPLYALHRDSSWGAGDFSDLEVLMRWVAEQGGSLVATLPLLSTLWELEGDPSPYAPASRLFWNEFYLDVTRTAEYAVCAEARSILEGTDLTKGQQALRQARLVDYTGQMRIKRRVLEALAQRFYEGGDARRGELEQYCRECPDAEDFARFRAVGERQGHFWPQWPEPLRSGEIGPDDYDEGVYRYHLYTQWQIQQQLRAMTDTARESQLLWYLDFPLGVNNDGYDVWRRRDVFARGASGGAPPDAFFTKGQNWGFPPLDPHALRRDGYRYLISALERHLAYSSVLRLDHVMALHRLYWVPEGLPASEGVYVRYPREELFAMLTLESHRHKAWIIGENLGTVPEVVNKAMEEHGVGDMYVVQYELTPKRRPPLRPISNRCVVSMNTHDMPPFAAYWTGLDIDDRLDLELLDESEASVARDEQTELRRVLAAYLNEQGLLSQRNLEPEAVLEACLAILGSSEAPMVLVNLEDLWQETLPQNTPGTRAERPNWRRKARYSFETFCKLPSVLRMLDTLNQARARKVAGPSPDIATPDAVERDDAMGADSEKVWEIGDVDERNW